MAGSPRPKLIDKLGKVTYPLPSPPVRRTGPAFYVSLPLPPPVTVDISNCSLAEPCIDPKPGVTGMEGYRFLAGETSKLGSAPLLIARNTDISEVMLTYWAERGFTNFGLLDVSNNSITEAFMRTLLWNHSFKVACAFGIRDASETSGARIHATGAAATLTDSDFINTWTHARSGPLRRTDVIFVFVDAETRPKPELGEVIWRLAQNPDSKAKPIVFVSGPKNTLYRYSSRLQHIDYSASFGNEHDLIPALTRGQTPTPDAMTGAPKAATLLHSEAAPAKSIAGPVAAGAGTIIDDANNPLATGLLADFAKYDAEANALEKERQALAARTAKNSAAATAFRERFNERCCLSQLLYRLGINVEF